MTGLSGWCATTAPSHTRDHATCADRIARGLIDACTCPEHLVSQGVPASADGRIGVAKSGPVSAATDRGLRPVPTKES